MPEVERSVEHTLLATSDAMVWAQEFCRIFQGMRVGTGELSEDRYVDEGTMVGWFANAMETGRNAGRDAVEFE